MNDDSEAVLGPREVPGSQLVTAAHKRLRELRRERRLIDEAISSLTAIAEGRQTRNRRRFAVLRTPTGS